ncbi:MAG TPA: DUF6493 family protein, partial [Verrucomicrobiae bacterium]|nr:DUF6493 family protein [Verrucomicrobiae bacterium]
AAIRWLATMSLHQPEPFFAMGALELKKIMNYSVAGSDSARAVFLEPLFDPQISFGPMAALALAIGLASENGDCAIQAREALAACIEHRRLDHELFGSTMAGLLGEGEIKPTRWAGNLAEISRLSIQHSEAVRDLLIPILRGDPQKAPRDLHALLALLIEVLSTTKSKLTDPAARDYLGRIETGGRTAKLIRQLLGK